MSAEGEKLERLADRCNHCKTMTPVVPAMYTGGMSVIQCQKTIADLATTRGWLFTDDGQGRMVFICPACLPLTSPPPPFNPRACCPKCGNRKLDMQYQPRGNGPFDHERILRTCSRCRYAWAEAPKDRPVSASPVLRIDREPPAPAQPALFPTRESA